MSEKISLDSSGDKYKKRHFFLQTTIHRVKTSTITVLISPTKSIVPLELNPFELICHFFQTRHQRFHFR